MSQLEDETLSGRDQKEEVDQDLQNEFYKWMDLFSEGKYNIVPGFFKLLVYLKKTKRDFAIVFRTFGHDLPDVIWEFNKFCSGEHPCYNGQGCAKVMFDGSKGTKDLRISAKTQNALFYRRDGPEITQTQFVVGTHNRQIQNLNESADEPEQVEDFYRGEIEEGNIEVFRDFGEIFNSMRKLVRQRASLAIQDDYLAYRDSDYEVGKLFIIDQ